MATITKRKGKRGTRYLAQIRLAGHKPASATFTRKSDAEEWIKVTEADIIRGRYFRHSKAFQYTMADLIDKYRKWHGFTQKKDAYTQGKQLDWWRDRIGDKLIGDVDSVLIGDIRDALAEPDDNGKARKGATVNRYLAILSHVFTYAERELKWAEENPCKSVTRFKDSEKRVRFLTDDERTALLDACKELDPTLYLVTIFALSTGARKGEITKLTWSNVDLKKGYATLADTKNTETRSVPLTGHLLDLMKAHKKVRVVHIGSDLVFPSPLDPARPWEFRTLWNKTVAKAELQDFHFHDTRHCFATSCLSSGATLPELMHLMGHKSPSMTARYAHLAKDHQTDIVARMNAKLFA